MNFQNNAITNVNIVRVSDGDKRTYPNYGNTISVFYTGTLPSCFNEVFSEIQPPDQPFKFTFGSDDV